jgi:CBS domain containing-hemolysin-like protein
MHRTDREGIAMTADESRRKAEEEARRAEEAAAKAERERREALVLTEAARDAALQAARKAGRFSREFLVTVISVVTTAFGVVVALAWNAALTKWLEQFSRDAQIAGLFIYALVVTLGAVLVIVLLGRLAQRIGAEPIQFGLQAKKEGSK